MDKRVVEMNWESIMASLILSLVFILGGVLWKNFPPKKINYLYGYRTRRSMANQQIWNYSNSIGSKMFIYLGIVLLIIGIISYFFFTNQLMYISLFSMLVGIGIGIYWCETQLDKLFDKNGNPK